MLLAFRREQGGSQAGPQIVNLRCPVCNQNGSFHPFAGVHDFSWLQKAKSDEGGSTTYAGGVRICPNTECNAVVFVVAKGSNLVRSFPAQVLDFDSTNLPPLIKDSLTEAVKCHSAECYKASALMVRRTLEELCMDKKAEGDNLKLRLQALSKNIIVPEELIAAADELRLLGNDAAHVEAESYDDIGEPEAALAIELTKELLKATYQYGSLLSKLKAMKKS